MEASAASDLRVESRNNIFVIAVLDVDCGSTTPVRVRNLSQNGALVEASALPPVGTAVLLKRGSLCVDAQVVWVDQQRAGLLSDHVGRQCRLIGRSVAAHRGRISS